MVFNLKGMSESRILATFFTSINSSRGDDYLHYKITAIMIDPQSILEHYGITSCYEESCTVRNERRIIKTIIYLNREPSSELLKIKKKCNGIFCNHKVDIVQYEKGLEGVKGILEED